MKNPALNWFIIVIALLVGGFGGYLVSRSGPEPTVQSPEKTTRSVPSQLALEIPIRETDIEASNIKVEAIAEGSVSAEILAPAKVTATPGSEAILIARASGPITKIHKRIGDAVKAGEVVAVVDSLEAASMLADRQAAAAKAELAKKTFDRESSLYSQGVTPRQEMENAQSALAVAQAEANKANLIATAAGVAQDGRSILITSPIAGRVTAQSAVLGAFVQPDSELYRIADSDHFQIEAYVTAADVPKIQAGDKASIMTRDDKAIPATVHSITPTVGGGNQAATILLTPDMASAPFVIGEGVQVILHAAVAKASGLLVPEDAVQIIEGREVLFVRTKEGFKPQPVVVGTRSGGYAQITSGIETGTLIATRNAFLIKAEMIKSSGDEE